MAAISSISNGEVLSSVRTKLNSVITEINHLDPTDWVDYSATSTVVGWSVLTTKKIRYRVIGKQVFVLFDFTGTSNSNSTTFTLPYTSNTNSSSALNFYWSVNNGASTTGQVVLSANSNTCILYTNFNATWTSSGTKSATGQLFYEIA